MELVIAMGGDGVVHHVAQGLIGTSTSLGVIASGTADVFARQLGMPLRPQAAAKLLKPSTRTRPVSVLTFEVSNDARTLSRSAMFSLGMGADAVVVEAAEADPVGKRGFGPAHFAAVAIRKVQDELAHDPTRLKVHAEDRAAAPIGAMAQFRDSYTYFGRFPLRLSPSTPNPMTVLLVNEMRVRRTAAMIRAAGGKRGLGSVRGFDTWEGVTGFSVEAERPVPVQADGEVIGRFDRLTAALLPHVLLVRWP